MEEPIFVPFRQYKLKACKISVPLQGCQLNKAKARAGERRNQYWEYFSCLFLREQFVLTEFQGCPRQVSAGTSLCR